MQITLSGLALVFLNFLSLLYFDPGYAAPSGGAQGPPRWLYFTSVLIVNFLGHRN